jgi:hypothetical protein
MVASTPTKVENKLNQWQQGKLNQLQAPQKTRAEQALNLAAQQLGITKREASEAAKELQLAQQNPNDQQIREFNAADQQTELAQQSLADILAVLFGIFGEENNISQEFITARDEAKVVLDEVSSLLAQRRQLIQNNQIDSGAQYILLSFESQIQKFQQDWQETKVTAENEPEFYEVAVDDFKTIKTETEKLKLQIQEQIKLPASSQNQEFTNIVNRATHIPPARYSRGKHWKGNSEDERRSSSRNGGPGQFLYSMTVDDVKQLERETLLTGEVVDKGNGNYHAFKNFEQVVGYANGEDAYWLRAELTGADSGAPTIHSHPRLSKN